MKTKLFTLSCILSACVGTMCANQAQIGDFYYDLNETNGTAEIVCPAYDISVNDKSVSDWDALPSQYIYEATCPNNAFWTGLKKIKVYANEEYINFLIVFDPAQMPSHTESDVMHIYINADNNVATGGFSDLFDYPKPGNTDLMFEGSLWDDNGNEIIYNPAVSTWAGPIGGEGWEWDMLPSSGKIGASQFVGVSIIEGYLIKKNIPWNKWTDKFSIGFDIQQNWNTVGLLPQGNTPDGFLIGRAPKMEVSFSDFKHYIVDGEVNIPASFEYNNVTYNVTSIGKGAFENCTDITSIIIPNSVTSIGEDAFKDCLGLTNITLPNSIGTIGKGAFENCISIAKITIPSSVSYLGENSFRGCTGLTSISLPNTITSINAETFQGCTNLTHISIPNNITNIDFRAFAKCTSLASISISNSVTNISNAFYGCNISEIYFVGSKEEWLTKYWSPDQISTNYALYIDNVLQSSITIPDDVTSIGEVCFAYCNSIKNIILPASLRVIGTHAFYCPNIETITCYSMRPPTVNYSFPADMPYKTIIYVPAEYINAYIMHDFWGLYNVHPLEQAIDHIFNDKSPKINKIIRNDQILILRGEKVYTITGQEVK